jgi:hypothetical protein
MTGYILELNRKITKKVSSIKNNHKKKPMKSFQKIKASDY